MVDVQNLGEGACAEAQPIGYKLALEIAHPVNMPVHAALKYVKRLRMKTIDTAGNVAAARRLVEKACDVHLIVRADVKGLLVVHKVRDGHHSLCV